MFSWVFLGGYLALELMGHVVSMLTQPGLVMPQMFKSLSEEINKAIQALKIHSGLGDLALNWLFRK